ncbi:HpcH/HpaI aldolase/citrate lyase family protein [Acidimangrovimonas sediminis]|uniref:HpcH/HpaI aldolase/citrate lyase family protein n=1 Tax=Acidimangrovimonas sediminis TaxID=2056283 RepID=UPI001E49F786|nr:aldolase/citrate lyase family protein [Acidimangrovimonas sediminis]
MTESTEITIAESRGPETRTAETRTAETRTVETMCLPLFVPGDRPDRFVKAAAAGADAVIVDLEDAVAPAAKDAARDGLATALAGWNGGLLLLRVNAVGTPWHAADLAAAAALPLAAVVLPKAESADEVRAVAHATGHKVIALVESALGIARAPEIAAAAARMAFGSIDYAADIAADHRRETLLYPRSALVVAARVAGRPAPLDGVTPSIADLAAVEADGRLALALGLSGKLLIHPAQVDPARRGFLPTRDEVDWATRVTEAAGTGAAVQVDGKMVDAPVVERAAQILRRARAGAERAA